MLQLSGVEDEWSFAFVHTFPFFTFSVGVPACVPLILVIFTEARFRRFKGLGEAFGDGSASPGAPAYFFFGLIARSNT
jgi:hypothetical protein